MQQQQQRHGAIDDRLVGRKIFEDIVIHARIFALKTRVRVDAEITEFQGIVDVLVHRPIDQSAGGQAPKDTTWAWVLVACAACMIVELGLLKAFKT